MEPTLRSRAAPFGKAAGGGAILGALVFAGVAYAFNDAFFASTQSFAVGALVFGFGLLGWSGTVFAGDSLEGMQRHLDTGTNWTEAQSRRAMALVTSFGAGWMAGSVVAASALGV